MSFTIGRSYGTGRNYKVPNYYVNSQNMSVPEGTDKKPSGSTNPTTRTRTTPQTTPTNMPGSSTTPVAPHSGAITTPGSTTAPVTPPSGTTTTPGSTTAPVTPRTGTSTTPGASTTPMTPPSGTTATPGTATPGSGTGTTTPGSTTSPIMPRITVPGPSPSPIMPGTGTSHTTPGTNSGLGSTPSRTGAITTPPSSGAGTGTAPGTTSQEISPFEPLPQGTEVQMDEMNYNIPYYMYPNLQPGTAPAPTEQPSPSMQPGMIPPATQPIGYPYNPTMPFETGESPFMNLPMNQGVPNMYQPNEYPFGNPMGVPRFPLYGYDNCADLDRDADYMKHLYPRSAKSIQSEIDKECDHMEYDGSVMFDEYPDKIHLERIVDRIYDKVKDMNEEPQMEAQSLYLYPPVRRDDYLRDLISILLLNEIFNRRRHYRGRKRWY